eukprot:CAMPEP_0118648502 /NCGR_PEP_ID=MMETSP0785-20121206/9191_1 /TAXON_ID=91992 /ORGANISM="Bolidomonas pacifica, Strain CCMP 1866" /LENGTH=644 /DNA_ID=CAMNT_0006540701 /DNA_START=312 /DNA_END=2246 /DNA_ORIENTATION=+
MNLKLFKKNNRVLADVTLDEPKGLDARLAANPRELNKTPSISGSDGSITPTDFDNISGNTNPLRRDRVKTLGHRNSDAASTDRMKRNTDSMLEDAVVSRFLKIRLEVRWEQVTKKSLVGNSQLSKFILDEITSGKSLEAVSAVKETDEKKSKASDLAIKAAMEGYFSNLDEKSLKDAKRLFMDNLQRADIKKGSLLCRQNDEGDKLFVLEEGTVNFIVSGKVAGSAKDGSVFGELSLVYGVKRQCDVQCMTDCIIWTLDTLAFRRIQLIVARDNLRTTKSKIMTKFGKEASTLSEEQETSVKKTGNKIPFNELALLSVVGQGTFGAVHIAHRKSEPEISYALKKMSKASIVDRENETRVLIERNALMAVKECPFIISIMGTYQDKDCIYFLTECVQGGNLISYMIDKDILTHSESMFYTYNIAMALIHTHNKGYIHRDIKPENCLIDKNGYVKLCDFGMAKRLPCTVVLPNGGTEVVRLAYTMCGTPEFMAPEFVLSTGYDHGVDFWALGCILVEMYSGRGPFDFDGDLKKTFKAVCLVGMGRKALDLPKQLKKRGMEAAGDCAKKLLTGVATRLGSEKSSDVVEHPYFSQLDKDEINSLKFQAPYIPKVAGAKDASNFKQDGEVPKEDPIEPYNGSNEWCEGF